MSYLIRRVLAKPRFILDEMCRLYGKFASYLRRALCKRRLIFPRINGPNNSRGYIFIAISILKDFLRRFSANLQCNVILQQINKMELSKKMSQYLCI